MTDVTVSAEAAIASGCIRNPVCPNPRHELDWAS